MSVTNENEIFSAIEKIAQEIPRDARIILFGSQARGDQRLDSDWDILIISDKEYLSPEEHSNYSYPFWELGWRLNTMIHPSVYTRHDWQTKASPLFRQNVEREGIIIC